MSPVGITIHAGLPNIKGHIRYCGFDGDGAFSHNTHQGTDTWGTKPGGFYDIHSFFDAHDSKDIYSDSCTTVTPESLAVAFYIKA